MLSSTDLGVINGVVNVLGRISRDLTDAIVSNNLTKDGVPSNLNNERSSVANNLTDDGDVVVTNLTHDAISTAPRRYDIVGIERITNVRCRVDTDVPNITVGVVDG